MSDEVLTDNKLALEAELVSPANSNVPKQLQAHAWAAGQSGNPSGRPSKLKTLTGMLESKVNRQDIADKLIKIASDDSTPALQLEAIKYIYSRIEGTPVQSMRHQVEGSVGALIFLHPGKSVSNDGAEVIATTDDVPTLTNTSNSGSDPEGPPSV